MVVKTFRVSSFSIINQCYLVYSNSAGFLVDPAWDYNLINGFIADNAIKLKGVLLTHSHPDHTNLAEEFARRYDIPVYMSGEEIETFGFYCSNLISIRHLQDIKSEDFVITPILTPGHTKGSICYLINNHLFTGDTIFIEGVGICSPEDANSLYDSVQYVKANLPPNTFIWPGHSFGESPGKDLDTLLRNNIYFQLDNRKHFVEFRLRKNRPASFNFK